MADIYINERFGRLFKTYRLKAGISTLKEFSDLMSTNGLYYDISNYTRWQNGERIPTDRKVILAMLRIFTYRNSVTDINECNLFLSAAKQSEITNTEILDNNINFTHSSFSKNVLPTPLQDFIGRESLLREVSWKLMSYNKICISGTPGIGKSSFTIYLANILQGIFKGDIFYYRADISFLDSIILDIATYYGVEVSNIKNVKDKIVYLTHLIQNRQIIIILDNIDNYEKIEPLLKNLEGYCKFILVSQFKPQLLNDSYNLVLTGFSEDEVILLAYHKFKTNFVLKNKHHILQLAKQVGYSPLALDILFSYIKKQNISLPSLISKIDKVMLPLAYHTTYDNKTIASSIELSTSVLNAVEKNIFLSFTIFNGSDVSIDALISIHNMHNENILTAVNKLVELSLVDRTKINRYQLHPLVKSYLKQIPAPNKWYKSLVRYYLRLRNLENEIENIRGVFDYCIKNNEYTIAVNLWNHIAVYHFKKGLWDEIKYYKKSLNSITVKDFTKINIIGLFLITYTMFWVIVWIFNSYILSFIFTASYGVIALVGGFYGMLVFNKWKSKTNIGKAIILFSVGLFLQEFGQLSYTVSILFNSYVTPYPSIGDVGFFGSVIFYIIGALYVGRASGIHLNNQNIKRKLVLLLVPFCIIALSIAILFREYTYDWSKPLQILLDFGYPLGQAIYLSMAILILLESKKTLGGVMKNSILGILFALFIQYIADFIFLYRYSHNLWLRPTDYGDILYLLAYAAMGIALLQFDYTYKLKDPNHPDFFTRVKNYLLSK